MIKKLAIFFVLLISSGVYGQTDILQFTDDFNRVNGTLGPNWTTVASNPAMAISSNRAVGLNEGSGGMARCVIAFNPDQYIEATFYKFSGGLLSIGNIYSRINSTRTTGYYLEIHITLGTPSFNIRFRKFGEPFELGSIISIPNPNGKRLGFRVVTNSNGSVTLTSYIDGVLTHQFTDSSSPVLTGDYVGLLGDTSNIQFDDFKVYSVINPKHPRVFVTTEVKEPRWLEH